MKVLSIVSGGFDPLHVGHLELFENSKLSYSYSHISNNDWGDTNPGTDNQQITFSKNF